MITPWQMYWITRLDGLFWFFVFLGIFSLLSTIPFIVFFIDEGYQWAKRGLFLAALVSSLSFIAAVFMPTTKQMAAILIIPKIVNNAEVQKLPDNVLELANEWMRELRPKGKGQ